MNSDIVVGSCAVLAAACCLTNWTGVATGNQRLASASKPTGVLAMALTAVVAGGLDHAAGVWLVVALVLGSVGDWALLSPATSRFIAGVFAFMVGHFAYLLSFAALGLDPQWWGWLVVVVLAASLWATRDFLPQVHRKDGLKVAVPVGVYNLVIAAMTVVGFLTGDPLIAVGAAIFVASDSLIAISMAKGELTGSEGKPQLAIMVSYHVGQALILAGVLLAR